MYAIILEGKTLNGDWMTGINIFAKDLGMLEDVDFF